MRFVLALMCVANLGIALRPPDGGSAFRRRVAPNQARKNDDSGDERGGSRGFDARFDGVGVPGSELGFVLFDAARQSVRGGGGGGAAVLRPGDLVIAGADPPALGIVRSQQYEVPTQRTFVCRTTYLSSFHHQEVRRVAEPPSPQLRRVYWQGVDATSGAVRRVDSDCVGAAPPDGDGGGGRGFEEYLVLYSPRYHAETGPVVARPAEARLIPLTDEVTASAWLAIPGLFWVWVAVSMVQYGQATGRM